MKVLELIGLKKQLPRDGKAVKPMTSAPPTIAMSSFIGIFAITISILTPLKTWASIPPPMKEVTSVPSAVHPIKNELINGDVVAAMIPTNMSPTQDDKLLKAQIADHSFKNFFQGSAFRNSSFGKFATKVERAAQPSINFGGNAKNSTQHKVDFMFEPQQQKANLKYVGWVTSNLTYTAPQDVLTWDTSTPLTAVSKLSLIYTDQRSDLDNKTTQIVYILQF